MGSINARRKGDPTPLAGSPPKREPSSGKQALHPLPYARGSLIRAEPKHLYPRTHSFSPPFKAADFRRKGGRSDAKDGGAQSKIKLRRRRNWPEIDSVVDNLQNGRGRWDVEIGPDSVMRTKVRGIGDLLRWPKDSEVVAELTRGLVVSIGAGPRHRERVGRNGNQARVGVERQPEKQAC